MKIAGNKSMNATTLINDLLTKAVSLGASDIHLEPHADGFKVRFRIDGLLQDIATLEKPHHAPSISRIKIMASLDIAESRLPQDGKIHVKIGGREFDLRVSTIPTVHGEKAVVRILNKEMALLTLEELGMSGDQLEVYGSVIKRVSGILLVTGPTGCGKTTTLYATLNKINSHEVNIITIEDPVEYELAGINQMNVNVKANLTFARGLRSILRQDPDVIMIGEIRDSETARIAVSAAMTGHLVLSTMHTIDAAGAISRLLDLGIEPSLINSSLTAVIAQRLVRLLCKKCKGKGCVDCNDIGFRGRTGLFEILTLSTGIKELVGKNSSSYLIRAEAMGSGMKSLKIAGEEKVMAGLTTTQEVSRAHLD